MHCCWVDHIEEGTCIVSAMLQHAASVLLAHGRGGSGSKSAPLRLRRAQALFGNLTLDVIVLTMLYSTAGLGIAIVNDFKSIEGDRSASIRLLLPELQES